LGQLMGSCWANGGGLLRRKRTEAETRRAPAEFKLLGRKQKRARMGKAEGERSKRLEQFKWGTSN
jgi:hypothetical protein